MSGDLGIDPIFSHPRLAAIYDVVDGERDDLVHYLSWLDEVGATSVLDVGCGTGTLACALALRGTEITAVDPAVASLEIAQTKAGAEQVRWVNGDATTLPKLCVDAAVMTGNVAQVFLDDTDWLATLSGIRAALRPDGHLIFETRDPMARGWTEWTAEHTRRLVATGDGGVVETWTELLDVALPLVTFRHTYCFSPGGTTLTSDSTLRFRERDELVESLGVSGFAVVDVRDAPDRPGKEFVFVARSVDHHGRPDHHREEHP
ncbi:MAG: class I SAM-dependent methyltransferase [Acidimicrobiales bacterium]